LSLESPLLPPARSTTGTSNWPALVHGRSADAGVGSYLHSHGAAAAYQAALEGYLTVFGWAALVFAVGAVVSATMLRSGPMQAAEGPVLAH
jgi:hypothetical protein